LASGGASSKQKGTSFERDTCKRLSLWVTKGERDDVFWRSAVSGGRATTARRYGRHVEVSGDITAVAPQGHKLTDFVHIECKHLASLDLDGFLLKHKGALVRAINQCWQQAQHAYKTPMLIARQNLYPTIVVTPIGITQCARFVMHSKQYPDPDKIFNGFELALFDDMLATRYRIPRLWLLTNGKWQSVLGRKSPDNDT
jgi:hypothetical protein